MTESSAAATEAERTHRGAERLRPPGRLPVATGGRHRSAPRPSGARATASPAWLDQVVGRSPAFEGVRLRVAQVGPTDATVLLRGETGTGKELVARAIQQHSRRASGPFVRVNCAAIPPSLIAAELFGHERGAFTGAVQRRIGRFEAASGGTIFLDEVGDLPVETQLALLRVLQEREIDRVGGTRPVRVDVRVIAATHRDLEALVASGEFRSDLYFRLDVFPIQVPPLRERGEDVVLLAESFVEQHAARLGKRFTSISRETIELLRSYGWPGNVRELQNVIERGVILGDGEVFTLDAAWLSTSIPPASSRAATSSSAPSSSTEAGTLAAVLADRERALIEAALAACAGRVSGPHGAAQRLGVPASTLESKIASYGIAKARFRDAAPPRGG